MILGFLKSPLLSFLIPSITLRFLRQLIIIILEISEKTDSRRSLSEPEGHILVLHVR